MTALFGTKSRSSKELDKQVAEKLNKKIKSATGSGSKSLLAQINESVIRVRENLGMYSKDYEMVTDSEELEAMFDTIIEQGIVALDTETMGLNFFTDDIVGLSVYNEKIKASYIPLNHISPVYQTKLKGQADPLIVKKQLLRLKENNVKMIYHNAKFDLNVLRQFTGVEFHEPYWDTMIASQNIRKDERNHTLKYRHALHCEKNMGLEERTKFNSFGDLFSSNVTYEILPLDVSTIYAARDAKLTYELYQYQLNLLSQPEYSNLYSLLTDIEFPLTSVSADMQWIGVARDEDYFNVIRMDYEHKLEQALKAVYVEIDKHSDKITQYKLNNINSKLDDPININSNQQLGILLYDILRLLHTKDGKKPVGEEALKQSDDILIEKLLSYRTLHKLNSTYIQGMDKHVAPHDGRIHSSFNQSGPDTGRYSSSEPNLQNLPRDGGIRQMLVASEGYYLISSDFSQQEPRILAHLSKDENLINAYKTGKDLYAQAASSVFNVPYEECLEFRPDGSVNKEGKKRRNDSKSIILGIMYGRGEQSIAEQTGTDLQGAQQLINSFFNSYPQVKEYIDFAQQRAINRGYTETVWGRRRYLQHIQKGKYVFEYTNERPIDFDPLFSDTNKVTNEVNAELQATWIQQMDSMKYWERKRFEEELLEQGIKTYDNSRDLAESFRQVVNSEIQGSAADMTKLAMLNLKRDKRLQELGYRLIISVHDETIGECPKENVKEVMHLVEKIMIEASAEKVSVPMKCDIDVMVAWNGDTINTEELA